MSESTAQNSHRPVAAKRLAPLPDPATRIVELRSEVAVLRTQVEKLTAGLKPTRFEIVVECARWLGLFIAVCYIVAQLAL